MKSQRIRVLLAASSLEPSYGGPAYSVARLAEALAEAGVETAVWVGDESAPAAPAVPILLGSAGDAFANFAPHVVHDSGLWRSHNHRLAVLAHRLGIPRIVSTRGMLEPWARRHKKLRKDLAWKLYQRRDLQSAARLHATSAPEAANVEMVGLGVPVLTIPNGVDIPELEARARNAAFRIALFLGRIYPIKGLPMLVEAWAQVRPEGWRLEIAGPDEAGHLREVERAVARFRIGDVVSFSGPLDEGGKRAALNRAELFVLPSFSESFGMVVAEALANSVPVLTTTATPWPMLELRDCGWLASPTVDSIAVALRRATTTGADRLAAMGRNGRDMVAAELGWDRVAQRFAAAYEAVAAMPDK